MTARETTSADMNTTDMNTFGHDPWPMMAVFGSPALMLERGSGTEVWDHDGNRYLDFITGLAVCSLGHANPVIADAIADQARRLVHVSNLFANPVAVGAATQIVDLMSEVTGDVGQVFFTNSGAESNECAFKLARKWGGRGRHAVVSAYQSFHGRTLATLAATGQPAKHEPFVPMPDGFRHAAFDDLDAFRAAITADVAAVVIETVQGEGGVNPASVEFLQGVRQICDETGALMIIDEVQTGFGRTGKWFGFQHAGIRPDVVTMAKAMGNGMPIGACWARREVAEVLVAGDHGSTYSGTALATAAVSAVISEMRRLDAPALARQQGARLAEGLARLDGVVSVRGQGLMLGAELADGIPAGMAAVEARQRGLLCNPVRPTTLRFLPPLTVSDDEIDEALQILADTFQEITT